jgi:hypothetical protein
MGILDRILQKAPGLVAQGLQGKRVGEDRQRAFDAQEAQRNAQIQRDALQQALMQSREEREAQLHPVNIRRQTALAADEEAQAQGLGRYAPKPPEAPPPRNIDPLSPEGIAARNQLEKYQASLRPKQVDPNAPKPGKILPASAVTALSGTENVLNAAKAAQQAMKDASAKGMNVTGPITGRLTAITEGLGMANPEAVSVRGKLANITSEIMKQRSGGAITPQEFVRLEPFLASKNDTEEYAAQKITDLITYLESNRDTSLQGFEDTGYDVTKLKRRAGDAPADDAEAQAAAFLAKRRKKP